MRKKRKRFLTRSKYFVKPNNEKSVKFMYEYFYILEKIISNYAQQNFYAIVVNKCDFAK